MKNCSECGKEILDGSVGCSNGGIQTENTNEATPKTKIKVYILISASIVFLVLAIWLVTSNEFRYNLENIDYYTQEYENAKYKSSGFLGSHYEWIASQWKELRDEAIKHVVLHSLGSVILFGGGVVGLYLGWKNKKVVVKKKDDDVI